MPTTSPSRPEPAGILLPTPPAAPAAGGLVGVTALLGALGSVGLLAGAASGGLSGPMLLSSALMLAGSVGTAIAQLDQRRRHRVSAVDGPRASFVRQLDAARGAVALAAAEQRRRALGRHPEAGAMTSLPADAVWTAREGEPGFLQVRWGSDEQPLEPPLLVPPETGGPVDPWCLAALRRFVATHERHPDLPAVADLSRTPLLHAEQDVARAIVCSAVFSHRPGDLTLELDVGSEQRAAWEWTKWLPHLRSSNATHTLVVHDRAAAPTPRDRATLLRVGRGKPWPGTPDRCDPATAEAVARRLATLADQGPETQEHPWEDVLGGRLPEGRVGAERLRVPIGTDDAGAPVHLDLKESAQGGMGPHGLLVGATGSGKSELLRTLVLGLVAAHPPEQLNLVLADFKGGATFAGLAPLPHVAALITNLADDLALVDRMEDALAGELQRRQELLRAAGGLASMDEYERRRDPTLEPMPALVIVVDEFSELLAARPQLVDLFVAIGRLGRSLGLHLLLATQRLEEGRLRGLESHLSYRLGLRTFSAAESQTVLGTSAAHALPPTPGLGYLRTDPSTLIRFRAAYVSGPSPNRSTSVERLLPFALASPHRDASHRDASTLARNSTLDAVVERLRDTGPKARAIWLPPLAASPSLTDLLTGPRGVPAIGLVDRPRAQRRDPLTLDLAGAAGHVAVVGGPRSGKSSLLRTTLAAVALGRSPTAVHLHVLDLGGSLADLSAWPHTSSYATRADAETVRRAVAELAATVERREAGGSGAELFLVVDSWPTFRESYDDLEPAVQRLAARGLAVGVHLVVSALRWSDLRSSLRDLFGTRLELRLGDPLDSEVGRHLAARVPSGRPGHGLLPDGASFVGALPPVDLITRLQTRWGDAMAPRLATLPAQVALDDLRPEGDGLVLGIGESDLEPVALAAGSHLLAVGDAGSGKSTLLHTLAREIVRLHGADAEVVVLDPRRSLAGIGPPDGGWIRATTSADAAAIVDRLAAELEGRLGRDQTPAPVHLLVDDYDLLAPSPGAGRPSPLLPLVPLLARGPEIGLRLLLTRRSGGVGRALYEPVVQALREAGAPVLLLSGSPDEGPLVGSHRLVAAVPGRARLIVRDLVRTIQVADGTPA